MTTQNTRNTSVPAPARVAMLVLSSMLLILLITYAILDYVAPEPVVALIPAATAPATAEPTATQVPPAATEIPAEPTATEEADPTATVVEQEPTETEVSPTETVEGVVEGTEVAIGDMKTADEEARPVDAATPTTEAVEGNEVPVVPAQASGNVLANPGFELGFEDNGVAKGWTEFNNGGAVVSYRSDGWPQVTAEGDPTQIIRILNADSSDRYAGMYQTVDVVPGRVYTFTINGLVRTNTGDVAATSFGYRMEVGFDPNGGQDWQAVTNWIELPWDEQLRLLDRYRIDRFVTTVTAENSKMTVFVRAWKKWADAGEGAFDVDSIALTGPLPTTSDAVALNMPVTGESSTLFTGTTPAITMALLLLLVGGTVWRIAHRRA